MRYLFFGFLLVLLDLHFTVGGHLIGILPDFAGYALIWVGLRELEGESPFFAKAKPLSLGLTGYALLTYVLDALGHARLPSVMQWVFGILTAAAAICLSWLCVRGVQDAEANRQTDLGGEKLRTAWLFTAVFQAAAVVSFILPALAFGVVLFSAGVSIWFLVRLYHTWKAWESVPAPEEEDLWGTGDRPDRT